MMATPHTGMPGGLPGMEMLLARHHLLAQSFGLAAMLLSEAAGQIAAAERRQLRQAQLMAQRLSKPIVDWRDDSPCTWPTKLVPRPTNGLLAGPLGFSLQWYSRPAQSGIVGNHEGKWDDGVIRVQQLRRDSLGTSDQRRRLPHSLPGRIVKTPHELPSGGDSDRADEGTGVPRGGLVLAR